MRICEKSWHTPALIAKASAAVVAVVVTPFLYSIRSDRISLKNTEKVVKNTDIVINNENNFNDYEQKRRDKDKDIEFKSNIEIKDQNNNRILLEEKKLRLDNKEVKIKMENNLIVDKIEIKDKLGSENKNYINKNEKEEDGKREEEERRRKEEEEKRRREEERRKPKFQKLSSNTNNRICNKCYSNCDMNCQVINYLGCCAFNGNEYCHVCGCYQTYHERSYYFYKKN